jgi:hypothetical protein
MRSILRVERWCARSGLEVPFKQEIGMCRPQRKSRRPNFHNAAQSTARDAVVGDHLVNGVKPSDWA